MKNVLLSALAGLAVINAASAAPSVEQRKEMCEKHPDKYVWVEKNSACIPINPCASTNESIKSSYCDEVTFADVRLPLLAAANVVALREYFTNPGSEKANEKFSYLDSAHNYMYYNNREKGTYMVYKFGADLDGGEKSAMEELRAICLALDGIGTTYYNDAGFASIDCDTAVTADLLQVLTTHGVKQQSDYVVTISFTDKGLYGMTQCYGYTDCYNK